MKHFEGKNINAERLLTLGDFDVRKIAAENPKMQADEYFSEIERFMENAPQYSSVLACASDSGALVEIGNFLKNVGYNGITGDIEFILSASPNGVPSLAATLRAQSASEKLDILYTRTGEAYSKRRFAVNNNGGNPDMTLAEALKYLDYKEAHRKLRILAVDDVAVVLNTINSVLSPYYDVFALTKAVQVQKFLTHTVPDLFLLDIQMPEIDGYKLVSLIRRFPAHGDTPIIFLTGNASHDNIKNAVDIGVCDFITKPVNKDVLLEKIERKIARKKSF